MTTLERSDTPPQLLLRVDEAARCLGVGRTTVYHLMQTRQLPVIHIGRASRIPRAALDDLVTRLQAGGRTVHPPAVAVGPGRPRASTTPWRAIGGDVAAPHAIDRTQTPAPPGAATSSWSAQQRRRPR